MTTDHRFDLATAAALRQLDPAGRSGGGQSLPLTPAERGRADAIFERILTSDPAAAPAATNSASRRGGAASGAVHGVRSTRRWWPVWFAPVAVAAALVIPGLIPGRDVAYASWTSLPVRLSPAASSAAVHACLKAQGLDQPSAAAPLIAERRGGWTYVLVPLAGNEEASCIMPSDAIASGRALRGDEYFGGSGERLPIKAGAGHIYQAGLAVGSTDEGLFTYTEGVVGRDVVGVTITTPRGVTVVASVDNGRYAAWWPAGRDKITSPEISEAPTFELTLRDGTTSREPPR